MSWWIREGRNFKF